MEFVSFRRALASLAFAANGLLWLVNALFGAPEMRAATSAMAVLYAVAYFSVSAGWFWGRWFGMGLCYFGFLYLLGAFQNPEYASFFLLLGGSHVIAMLCLFGSSMASVYDGMPEWRLAFNVDEDTARRLGRSVQSAATTLPILILQILGPRQESAWLVLAVLGLSLTGFYGLLRLRTWSLLAFSGAGIAWLAAWQLPQEAWALGTHPMGAPLSALMNVMAGAGLFLPMLVWLQPLRRALKAR